MQNVVCFYRHHVGNCNCVQISRNTLQKAKYLQKYSKTEYSKYDNYDAINVNKTKDIPYDYDGIMGVPITFIDKYNHDQFEIIGKMTTTKIDEFNYGYPYINGKKVYARILIKRKRMNS